MTAVSGLLIVDKPAGMTSHDVVSRVRRLAATRRVGHAGTLDPMATGVLVLGVGKATRLLGHLMLAEKTYAATIRLGQSTTTDDAEGEPVGGSRACDVPESVLNAGIAGLTGEIMQVPPAVSAIKIGGERAYRLTRAGQAPELKPRPVTVREFTVTAIRRVGEYLDVDATVRCSSGTYIRALARDLGTALATGGHLTALRRTAVGPYGLDQAHALRDLQDQAPSGNARPGSAAGAFLPVTPLAEAAAAVFPALILVADDARRLAQGARLPLPSEAPVPAPGAPDVSPAWLSRETAWPSGPTPVAAFGPDGTLIALVTAESGQLRSLAVFA